jgi:hypothetical protein
LHKLSINCRKYTEPVRLHALFTGMVTVDQSCINFIVIFNGLYIIQSMHTLS